MLRRTKDLNEIGELLLTNASIRCFRSKRQSMSKGQWFDSYQGERTHTAEFLMLVEPRLDEPIVAVLPLGNDF